MTFQVQVEHADAAAVAAAAAAADVVVFRVVQLEYDSSASFGFHVELTRRHC